MMGEVQVQREEKKKVESDLLSTTFGLKPLAFAKMAISDLASPSAGLPCGMPTRYRLSWR